MIARRHWIVGSFGAVALGAGVGWGLRRESDLDRQAAPTESIWALRLPTPDGGELALASLRGRPLVLNFWATWCPPCLREMPALDRFHRAHAAQGWQVLGLAIDHAAPVRDYLQRHPVSYPIALAGFQGIELARELGNSAGGLPFTVVFDKAGRVTARKLGEASEAEMAAWTNASTSDADSRN